MLRRRDIVIFNVSFAFHKQSIEPVILPKVSFECYGNMCDFAAVINIKAYRNEKGYLAIDTFGVYITMCVCVYTYTLQISSIITSIHFYIKCGKNIFQWKKITIKNFSQFHNNARRYFSVRVFLMILLIK